MRIFVPSAAAHLTDSIGFSEGLIAWQLLAGLAERGHEIVACAPCISLASAPPFEVIETGLARWESVESFAYARAAARRFEQLGGLERFDVVHWLFPDQPANTLYAPPLGITFVVGPIAPAWPVRVRPRRRLGDGVALALRPLNRRRRRAVLARASAILVSTPGAASALPPDAAARARVVPFGVDIDRFVPTPPAPGARILFVGRLDRLKGVRELVEAFARVRLTLPEARLVIAGEGRERAWIEAQNAEGVELRGAVPHHEVPRLLADATLVCLPSYGEPYGMAILEAMAAARPVVAAGGPGPRFLVDPRGGRLVPPRDADALAGALFEILSDRARNEAMGRFNRLRVERELSLSRMLDLVEAAYAGSSAHLEVAA